MRKLITFLIVVNFTNLIVADVRSPEEMERRKENVLDNFKPNRVHFDGLLESTVVFSQEEYGVGDTIDIKIHYKLNAEKNTKNMKFAILDYSLGRLRTRYVNNPTKITQDKFIRAREDKIISSGPLEFIDCDPDLILGNENPVGTYHIKFSLKRRVPELELYGKKYPYCYSAAIWMNSFMEEKTKKYEFITIYRGGYRGTVPLLIKVNPTALKNRLKTKESRN